MKHYSQLTPEQRYIIYSMLKIGLTQSMIAKVIGVDKSTVSRELKRNSGKRGYRPKQADAFAKDRQQGKSKDRIDNITCSFIKLLTERKSGLALIYKVDRRTKENTEDAIKRLLSSISGQVHTITSDNGKEFANHEKIAKRFECDFYFAHPYSSWERGTNENTNGLIRQYFPKDRDFRTITDKELIHAMKRINNRPRKRLGYKTPNQVFFEESYNVALTT